MSLHDELMADQKAPSRCISCSFLGSLDDDQRAEWLAEFALPNTVVTHAALARAMARRGFEVSPDAVKAHRSTHVEPA